MHRHNQRRPAIRNVQRNIPSRILTNSNSNTDGNAETHINADTYLDTNAYTNSDTNAGCRLSANRARYLLW
jgi:hypothetical protein